MIFDLPKNTYQKFFFFVLIDIILQYPFSKMQVGTKKNFFWELIHDIITQ